MPEKVPLLFKNVSINKVIPEEYKILKRTLSTQYNKAM